jgi:hypothetical protein
MIADFDGELRGRLARLAAGVPVATDPVLDVAARPVVRRAPAARRFAAGAFVPMVVVVAAVVVATLSGVRPFAPAATGTPQVASTVRDGPFELSITSGKARYGLREPIDVRASLTYRGPERSVAIFHGAGGPMAFGVVERVDGLFLSPAWRESCVPSTLEPAVPLQQRFAKSGSFSGGNPAASDAPSFFEDPTLELPGGTWHVYVLADFGVGGCGVDRHLLRADLAIVVGDTGSMPEAPTPGPSIASLPPEPTLPHPSRAGASASDTDGDFELTLQSDSSLYRPDELITIEGSLTYRGQADSVDVEHDSAGLVLFGIRERVFGEIDMDPVSLLTCDRSTLHRNVALVEPFRKSGGFSSDHPAAESFRAFLMDPRLRLPAGTWHVYAESRAPCMGFGPAFTLQAEIVITVAG